MYISPFSTRYAGSEMQKIFSEDFKFTTWRRLWVSLAKAQKKLGLDITDQQIQQMSHFIDTINYDVAKERERIVRHDVMAHVHAFGIQCPLAAPIIHLGATSCYVGDNTDLIIMREALKLVRKKIVTVIRNLSDFAEKYKDMPTLGFTHFQPAQLTTVGKRATLWIHDLLLDLEEIDFVVANLKFLGSKGTTGTQASFMELFENDGDKVLQLEHMIAADFDFDSIYPVSGQTYSRKIDSRFMNVLAQIASSCAKFSNDIRLLQGLKEIEEPFETNQIGSSAMAYKRNPMRCERMAALCRYVIADMQNTAMTASSQWLERTLDDSANKRVAIPEAFLAIDGVLNIYINVSNGLVVYPEIIQRHILEELPFMATENIMMECVKAGGNRQEIHEAIRIHSIAAAKRVKQDGLENDLLIRIANDPIFNTSQEKLEKLLKPHNFTGRAAEQTAGFLRDFVAPVLQGCDFSEEELKI
ncbi:MAG: adenylosuccinate lyase [Defluviitaleaceae bacterium]|nr:adenylosuccinate lyase [Defluviitaleaceae bacterium]